MDLARPGQATTPLRPSRSLPLPCCSPVLPLIRRWEEPVVWSTAPSRPRSRSSLLCCTWATVALVVLASATSTAPHHRRPAPVSPPSCHRAHQHDGVHSTVDVHASTHHPAAISPTAVQSSVHSSLSARPLSPQLSPLPRLSPLPSRLSLRNAVHLPLQPLSAHASLPSPPQLCVGLRRPPAASLRCPGQEGRPTFGRRLNSLCQCSSLLHRLARGRRQ